MRSFWPIYKRELFAFFVTPLAWVLIGVFLVVQGMHFYLARRPLLAQRRDRERPDAAAGVLRQHRPPLPGPLPARPADDDAPLRRGAPQRHDRDADDRAGLERGGRPREVRRGADDVRRDVGADGALSRHPARATGELDWHVAAGELPRRAPRRRGVPLARACRERAHEEPVSRARHDRAGHPGPLHPRHRRVRRPRGDDAARRLRLRLGVGADERLRERHRRLAARSCSTRRSSCSRSSSTTRAVDAWRWG